MSFYEAPFLISAKQTVVYFIVLQLQLFYTRDEAVHLKFTYGIPYINVHFFQNNLRECSVCVLPTLRSIVNML